MAPPAVARRGRARRSRALQADERVGAHDQLPPALDGGIGIVGDAVIGPAQVIFGVVEARLDPRAHAERVARRLRDRARQVGHEVPAGLGRHRQGIGGDLVLPDGLPGGVDGLADEALLGAHS